MNLKTSLPKGIPEEPVFSLPFDIAEDGGKTNGHLTADREYIRIYDSEDREVSSHEITAFTEFEATRQIGCSMLRGKRKSDGKWQFFCAFTQTHYIRFAELAKILDYYVNTGVFTDRSDTEEPTCPKCGVSLHGSAKCPYCAKKSGTVLRLMKRLSPFKKLFILSLLLTAVDYVCNLVAPTLQRYLIDDVVEAEQPDMNLFFIIAATMIGLAILATGIDFITRRINIIITNGFIKKLRSDLFNKTQELSMKAISRRTTGELIRRVSEDARTVQQFVTDNGKEMILHAISLIALLIIMFVTNWKLALLVVIPLPLAAWIASRVMRILDERNGRWWRKMVASSRYLHDMLSGIRVVKSYGSEERETARYTRISQEVSDAQKNIDCIWYILAPLLHYVLALGQFSMLYFGASAVMDLEITLGEFVQFTSYVSMLYGPLEWLTNLPRILSQAMVSAGKAFEILDERVELHDSDAPEDKEIAGGITFDHVYFGYSAYDPVLKDISLEIKPGEMIGIVGHSGVGKSTLINLIMRLYDPTSGSIKIDGTDLRDMSSANLHGQMGVVLQETFLFNGTVLENIAYAKPEATFEEIVQAAKTADCHDFITRLPDGYNTYVGEKGYNLSGGERQRVAIARAILRDPKILILDEATASLDTQTEKQIQTALNRLIKGRTTIAIAHRLSTLSSADRLIVLDKGRLAEMGSHNELMRRHGVYYELVMAQRSTAAIKKQPKAEPATV
ncbi:MAG: ABC transporter ATP-binding protein [Oscillospiraceae bacterium]|nr:ABC transporter ATP-binding protein [Oscillospiraceae bacterium]